jgi:hypothetical protein
LMLDTFVTVSEQVFKYIYNAFNQYLVSNVLAFAKGFEVAIAFTAAAVFLLIAVGITIRQAKRRMPKSYRMEIIDLDGKRTSIDGLRYTFSTYDAAESYAKFYQKTYERQYRFKVVGSSKSLSKVRRNASIKNSEAIYSPNTS